MSSIFVSIISQDEDFLEETINNAMHKSSKRNEINFGIIEQNSDGNFISNINSERIKIKKIKCGPRGVGLPRNESMTMYGGEDYVLVLDAHTIFNKGWDEILIRKHKYIEDKEKCNVVISQHLFGASVVEDQIKLLEQTSNLSRSLYFDGLVIRDRYFSGEYIEQYAVTCHFIFGRPKAFIDTPFDPRVYYLAEESLLSARLWTNGYRMFSIANPPIITLNKVGSRIKNDWRKSVDAERMALDFEMLVNYFYLDKIDDWSARDLESLKIFKNVSGIDVSCVFNNLNIEFINKESVEKVKKMILDIVNSNNFDESVTLKIGKIASKSQNMV